MKRYRAPRMKDGELKLQYGKLEHESPDLIVVCGVGIPRCDGALLHHVLCSERFSVFDKTWDKSFVDELESRGYDITTLKLTVQKKTVS